MEAWGYRYISNIVWHKVRKDGGSDGRGVGFYFRNVTELLLFGVRGKSARTLAPGRSQVNMIQTRKREHSRKPDEQYKIIEECSWGPRLEMFAAASAAGWERWGNQADDDYQTDLGHLQLQQRHGDRCGVGIEYGFPFQVASLAPTMSTGHDPITPRRTLICALSNAVTVDVVRSIGILAGR